MGERTIVEALARQLGAAWRMTRDAIKQCPEDEWRKGETASSVPARLMFHLIQAADFHLNDRHADFDWNRFGVSWQGGENDELLSRDRLLEYQHEVQLRVEKWLAELGDDGLVQPDRASEFYDSVLERFIYALRHLQHHLGQVNVELRRRGLNPAEW